MDMKYLDDTALTAKIKKVVLYRNTSLVDNNFDFTRFLRVINLGHKFTDPKKSTEVKYKWFNIFLRHRIKKY